MYLVSKLRYLVIMALVVVYAGVPRAAAAADRGKLQLSLGNAGMPFAWSTAVADLDSDETLDFAIADRTGHSTEGYHYRLKLALSREGNQTFQFRSPDSSLNISIIDLDNDADLDVVLTHAISGEIAGVWINNGSGAFHQGNAADFPLGALSLRQKVIAPSGNVSVSSATLPNRKKAAGGSLIVRCHSPVTACSGTVVFSEIVRPQSLSNRFVHLRAPPTTFLS
jgi:hypothetical protein